MCILAKDSEPFVTILCFIQKMKKTLIPVQTLISMNHYTLSSEVSRLGAPGLHSMNRCKICTQTYRDPPSSSLEERHNVICCSVTTEEAESIGRWVSTSLSRSDVCIRHSVRRICTNFTRWPPTLIGCQHSRSKEWHRNVRV